MARLELRNARNTLIEEKNRLDQEMTTLTDKYNLAVETLGQHRRLQFEYREGKESLPNTNSSKGAKKVFNDKIVEHQIKIDEIQKTLEEYEKSRVVLASKIKAMDKSIKELQTA